MIMVKAGKAVDEMIEIARDVRPDPGGPMMSKSEQVGLVELRKGRPLLILARIVSSEPKPQR